MLGVVVVLVLTVLCVEVLWWEDPPWLWNSVRDCVVVEALANVARPEGLVSLGHLGGPSAKPLTVGGVVVGAAFWGLETLGSTVCAGLMAITLHLRECQCRRR